MDDKNKSHMMITALAWVKRGYSKAVVDEAPIPNPEEQKQMIADMEGVEQLINEGEGEDKFDMENYDKEDNIPVFGEDYAELIGKADLEDDGEGDIEMDDEQYPYQVDEDEEDKEDIVIKNTDALIVTAAAEQEYSNLEVYIYEEDNSNLFVHHELMLNAYPLCLEWLPYKPGEKASLSAKGNYIAVGTFKPGIEIWSLDVVDAVAPIMTLGGETKAAANVPLDSMKRKKKMLYYKEGSHLDAVLCLAAHPTQVNFLASGSADRTIKIWDLGTQTCIRTIKNHKEKVQVLEWQPGNDKMLLSAGFDGKGVITNTKNPNEKIYLDFKNTEIESGCWHPTQTN
jgi:periodic tryptophan protein 1